MNYKNVVESIDSQLTSFIEEEYKSGQYKFHSKEFTLLGVRTNYVRKIISDIYKEIKNWDEKEIYKLIELLLQKQFNEYILIGFGLALKSTKNFTDEHFTIFESWIANYVIDWGQCDDLCGGVLGKFMFENPDYLSKVISWAEKENVWFKRASAVSLIYSLRKGKYLEPCFEIADKLLLDEHDMVQKGYGWMLKVASSQHQEKVFEFVLKRKGTMPRTALRYAIEKMPKELKMKAMEK